MRSCTLGTRARVTFGSCTLRVAEDGVVYADRTTGWPAAGGSSGLWKCA